MEFFFAILVVLAVSAWLGLRVYRFFRRAAATPRRITPDCAAGCPACTEDKNASSCSELAGVAKGLFKKESGDRIR
jgi:hypothetical protein